MVFRKNIQEFLKNTEIAVIGASSNSKKFGNIVLKNQCFYGIVTIKDLLKYLIK